MTFNLFFVIVECLKLKILSMRISLLIPAYNEEKTIRQCLNSCLNQSRPPDQILVVDDCSTDKTPQILSEFGDQIEVVRTPHQSGNKSRAQEFGFQFIRGDILIMTDADTILHQDFIKNILTYFYNDRVAAVAGYVQSLPHNLLTACREIDYFIGQRLHKRAQSFLHSVFIIPGCAAAFRTDVFRRYIKFSHDTLTEDLDFTYTLYQSGFAIRFAFDAVSFTQDPPNLSSYIRQMKRWYTGGWQNLLKHFGIFRTPAAAIELSLLYLESLAVAGLIFILPLINLYWFFAFLGFYLTIIFSLAGYIGLREKRLDIIAAAPLYLFISLLNLSLFIYTFVRVVFLQKRLLKWSFVDRVEIKPKV